MNIFFHTSWKQSQKSEEALWQTPWWKRHPKSLFCWGALAGPHWKCPSDHPSSVTASPTVTGSGSKKKKKNISASRERELKADRHYPASKTHAESKRPLRTRVSGSAGYRCHCATRGVGASMPDGSSATPATPTLVKMPPPPRRSPIFLCPFSSNYKSSSAALAVWGRPKTQRLPRQFLEGLTLGAGAPSLVTCYLLAACESIWRWRPGPGVAPPPPPPPSLWKCLAARNSNPFDVIPLFHRVLNSRTMVEPAGPDMSWALFIYLFSSP